MKRNKLCMIIERQPDNSKIVTSLKIYKKDNKGYFNGIYSTSYQHSWGGNWPTELEDSLRENEEFYLLDNHLDISYHTDVTNRQYIRDLEFKIYELEQKLAIQNKKEEKIKAIQILLGLK